MFASSCHNHTRFRSLSQVELEAPEARRRMCCLLLNVASKYEGELQEKTYAITNGYKRIHSLSSAQSFDKNYGQCGQSMETIYVQYCMRTSVDTYRIDNRE